MAITNNGAANSLPASQLPSGYTRPTVTTFADWEYKRTLSLSVLKATVENATRSTTMTNIRENATVGINKQIVDIIAADFLASATVTTYGDWTGLSNNFVDVTGTGTALADTAASYTCTVILYVKAV
jgi:hypothetical protein|tara:strand:+ start:39 stop:419 length:381 start_codon:yes stop_codon:yes gene_type:complete